MVSYMPTQAPIFELPKKRQRHNKPQQQPQPKEPLPWGEGEPESPQEPPFLPAA